jgi:hypothetical protein
VAWWTPAGLVLDEVRVRRTGMTSMTPGWAARSPPTSRSDWGLPGTGRASSACLCCPAGTPCAHAGDLHRAGMEHAPPAEASGWLRAGNFCLRVTSSVSGPGRERRAPCGCPGLSAHSALSAADSRRAASSATGASSSRSATATMTCGSSTSTMVRPSPPHRGRRRCTAAAAGRQRQSTRNRPSQGHDHSTLPQPCGRTCVTNHWLVRTSPPLTRKRCPVSTSSKPTCSPGGTGAAGRLARRDRRHRPHTHLPPPEARAGAPAPPHHRGARTANTTRSFAGRHGNRSG